MGSTAWRSDPKNREHDNAYMREYMRRRNATLRVTSGYTDVIEDHDRLHGRAPDDVLEERERARLNDNRDLTARLMGDPLPGRSALDKQRVRL